ncbi:MAG: MaoC family dehydratase [Actinomycetota bacterium]
MTIYLEELSVGTEVVSERRVVTAEDIDAFCELSGDHNSLHTDDDHARAAGFGGRIAHGLLVLSISGGLVSDEDDWAIGAYLEESRRFVEPVLPGDEIYSVSRITEIRRSRSKSDRGIVTMTVETRNQREEVVLAGTDIVLVGARGIG